LRPVCSRRRGVPVSIDSGQNRSPFDGNCDHTWETRPPDEAGILLTNTCTKCGAKVA